MRKDRTIEKRMHPSCCLFSGLQAGCYGFGKTGLTDAPGLAVDYLISERDVVDFERIATLHTRKNETLS